jgi:hypothetical protein
MKMTYTKGYPSRDIPLAKQGMLMKEGVFRREGI